MITLTSLIKDSPLTQQNLISPPQRFFIKSSRLPLLLLVLHFVLRLLEQNLVDSGMSGDALEQLHLINSWKWKWGYSSTQPPLYSWLFKLFIQFCDFLGLNFRFADSLFRQCLITISPLIGYLILRHYKVNQRDAAFSSAGIFLLSDFAWDIQDTFTHSTIAIVTLYWFMFEFIKFYLVQHRIDMFLLA